MFLEFRSFNSDDQDSIKNIVQQVSIDGCKEKTSIFTIVTNLIEKNIVLTFPEPFEFSRHTTFDANKMQNLFFEKKKNFYIT